MSELKPNPLPLSTPFPPSPRRAPLGTVAKPLPIIIDCDPGHDDAMALAVAFARPELKVLGVTAVAGNASLPKTYENLRRTLALLGANGVACCRWCRCTTRATTLGCAIRARRLGT